MITIYSEGTYWSPDPSEWPNTPPLEVYVELERNDSNLFWRMESGHAQNLLDAALERLGFYDD